MPLLMQATPFCSNARARSIRLPSPGPSSNRIDNASQVGASLGVWLIAATLQNRMIEETSHAVGCGCFDFLSVYKVIGVLPGYRFQPQSKPSFALAPTTADRPPLTYILPPVLVSYVLNPAPAVAPIAPACPSICKLGVMLNGPS